VAGPNALSQFQAIFSPIHKDGYKFVGGAAAVTLVAFYIWDTLGFICLLATLALAFFFRDPKRVVPDRDGLVVAPSDGTVISVNPMLPPAELNLGAEPMTRVSVFLSLLDVHVARAPVAGRILTDVHTDGIYKNAAAPEAPSENERQSFTIETKTGTKIGVVLVSGYVARRIITNVKVGDAVTAGERIGIIRFGSRTDLYLPAGTVFVSEGQRMIAGETVVAELGLTEPTPRRFARV
jgi:phosphatidylserine decarboxylase